MATFTIDSDNNIVAHAGLPPAGAHEPFATLKDLTKLTASWPISRLVEIWNSFAGIAPFNDLKPVKKFPNRKDAVTRIWNAVERLVPMVSQAGAAPAATVAPEQGKANKAPAKANRRDTARPGAKGVAKAAPDSSKKAEVIELMRHKSGITLAAIMKLTGWQAHTVRGFVSGMLVKKLGLKLESFRSEDKERTYRIKS